MSARTDSRRRALVRAARRRDRAAAKLANACEEVRLRRTLYDLSCRLDYLRDRVLGAA